MAATTAVSCALLSIFLILLSPTRAIPSEQLAQDEKFPPCPKNLTSFPFFLHTTFTGSGASGLQVAGQKTVNTSAPPFGAVTVWDKVLAIGANPKSTVIGRLQGLYVSAAQKEVAVLMTANLVFYASKTPNSPKVESTVAVQARLTGGYETIAIPIVGGTGDYEGIHGNMLARRISEDKNSQVVAYNMCYLSKK